MERCEIVPTDAVYSHVVRLANPPVRPKVDIGSRFTGKREFSWDSRSGTYSESLPLVSYDEWLIQVALCPTLLVRRRNRESIRQK